MTTTKTDFQYDVFISYARKDGATQAQNLYATFRQMDKRVYLDTTAIEGGQTWESNLHEALLTSKAVIFILTSGSVTPDSYCKIEWEIAVEHHIPILPVLVVSDKSEIVKDTPKPYSTIQYINLTTDRDAGIDEISHFLTRYDYLYELRDELATLVSQSTARRFIEIIATENAEAKKQLKRRVKVRIPQRQQPNITEFNSFGEAWEHYNGQVLLLGTPGAGKTTTLLHYAQTLVKNYLADRNQPVPVFASIAYWDSYKNQPLHEWLPEENDLPDDMRDVIDSGRAVLILDGLDELGNSKPINPQEPPEGTFDPRLLFLQRVQATIDYGNQVLITCRVADYEDIGEKLDIKGAIELQPLTNEQIKTYLGDVPTVQTTVMIDSDLLDICRSPLLLSLIAFGYRDATDDLKALPSMLDGDLRDAIFERYINQSYDLEVQRRELVGEEIPFTLEKVLDVLGHAAMINVCGGIRDYGVNQRNISEIIENILTLHDFTFQDDEEEVIPLLIFVEYLNIIEIDEKMTFSFLHLLLRDYLATRFSLKYIFVDPLYSNFQSPAFALGKLKNTDALEPLIQILNTHEDDWIRDCAAQALGDIGDNRAVDSLIHALMYDEDSQVRKESAKSLGEIGDIKATKSLIHALQNDEDSRVRSYSAKSLGTLKDKGTIGSLFNSLYQDENRFVRAECAKAIGNIDSQTAIEHLLEVLQSDMSINVREAAAWTLGEIGDVKTVDALIQSLFQNNNVQFIAAEALNKIGTTKALQAIEAWYSSHSAAKD